MAPSNGTTYSSKVGRHPPPATIAHYNGTLQWHPAMAPRPLPQSWSSPSPPTIAHYNGTLRWRSNGTTSSAPCSGTLVPRPIRQSGSSPSPPIGSKNPYSYRYLGKNTSIIEVCRCMHLLNLFILLLYEDCFPWTFPELRCFFHRTRFG